MVICIECVHLCIEIHFVHQISCSPVYRTHCCLDGQLGCSARLAGRTHEGKGGSALAVSWRNKLWVNIQRWICQRRGVEVWCGRLIRHSAPLPRWVSAPSAALQPGPKRNRYSCLLPGHVDLSQPCLQGLGGGPLTYYLVLASLSFSQRDLHQRALSAGLFYIHSGCVGLPLCLAFSTMRGVLLLWLKAKRRFMKSKQQGDMFVLDTHWNNFTI